MKMKSLKTQFIAAIAMVLVAAIAMGSSTYAWFAMNKEVKATNMKVTATTEGSLVITRGSLPTATTSATTVDINDASATQLLASTHDSTWATYTNGLKYVNNPDQVSAETGLALGTTDLAFSPVDPNADPAYFKDYVVYIASAGSELQHQDVTITLDPKTVLSNLNDAVSVDFYYMQANSTNAPTPGATTFVGTLNVAGLDPTTNNATATLTSITISDITIPKAGTTNGAITVMMRVFIDGALKDTINNPADANHASPYDTTFIKTKDAADITAVTLNAKFVATTHT